MRVMAIVSADYGELGGALYFLQGLALREAPVLLIPPALRGALAAHPGVTVGGYATLADIRARIAAFRPDAVVLCSGYLLTIGKRLSFFKASLLLRWLRRRGIAVLTSDPFLGLLDSPAVLDFTQVLGPQGGPLMRRLKSRLVSWRLYLLRRQLRGCLHIYPAPIQRLHGPQAGMGAFFNAAVCEPDLPPLPPAAPRRWIFVLSSIDYQLQLGLAGPDFVAQLAARLREARALADRVELVGPAPLIEAMRRELGDEPGFELEAKAAYADFMGRLMRAEYAFFWNLYSFSLIHRVLALRPVLFFDEGHMVRILPALHEAGVRLFYDGWRPPMLDLAEPLDARALARGAQQALTQFRRIAQGLQQGEAPLSLLRRCVSANQRNVLDAQA